MYKIKNWTKFQHFKDRRPPWVKLYRDLLDDLEWHELDPLAAKSLVMIWLIASETDGILPDVKKLAFRLRLSENSTKSIVSKLSHWLEQADINVISERYQDDSLETETETETETEKKTRSRALTSQSEIFVLPDWVNQEHWDAWHSTSKRKKATNAQKRLAIEKLDAWRVQGQDYAGALREAALAGWQGLFLPDDKTQTKKSAEPAWRTEQKERMAKIFPEKQNQQKNLGEVFDVAAKYLD